MSYLCVIVSIVGIIGATFYFTTNRHHIPFILVWSLAQLIVIDCTTTNSETNESVVNPILDLTQSIKIEVGFAFSFAEKTMHIAVNVLSIIFLGLTIMLSFSVQKGKAQRDLKTNNQMLN